MPNAVVVAMTTSMNRRTLLRVGLAGFGAVAVGCTAPPARSQGPDAREALAQLEARMGGRLGVFALDTATQATTSYRADERFLLCSTGKALTVAAVLKRSEAEPGLLDAAESLGRAADDLVTQSQLAEEPVVSSRRATAGLRDVLIRGLPGAPAQALAEDRRLLRLQQDMR